ncbi:MAG: YciI family protein [Bacteroidota bacterium]
MTKFMYLFRGGEAGMGELSPEESQAHMEKWKTWMGQLAQDGKLVDGLPLARGGAQVHKRGDMVVDGPYAEGKEIVGGYLIVNAETLDQAVDLSKGCPIFDNDGTVEVREILSMGG